MRQQYSPIDTDLETYDKIRARKQLPGESFAKFSVAVSLLASRLMAPLTEGERLEHLRANMNVGLKNALLYHPTYSVFQLQELAKRYEKLMGCPTDGARPNARRISEIHSLPQNSHYQLVSPPEVVEEHNSSLPVHIEAIANADANAPSPVHNRADLLCCWNCDDIGHTYLNCESSTRNVFCYGCGEKNTYKPNCVKCNPGNTRQGGASQPFARPNQNPRAQNPFRR